MGSRPVCCRETVQVMRAVVFRSCLRVESTLVGNFGLVLRMVFNIGPLSLIE